MSTRRDTVNTKGLTYSWLARHYRELAEAEWERDATAKRLAEQDQKLGELRLMISRIRVHKEIDGVGQGLVG